VPPAVASSATPTGEPTPEPVATLGAEVVAPPVVVGGGPDVTASAAASETVAPSATPEETATATASPVEEPTPEATATTTVSVSPLTVRVTDGDTLTDLAVHYYGNATPKTLATIRAANPWLDDPDVLWSGKLLTLPPPRLRDDPHDVP
jgi:nucleoid-associated protein YgaU